MNSIVVVISALKQPDTFCLALDILRLRSARLLAVNDTCASLPKSSTAPLARVTPQTLQ